MQCKCNTARNTRCRNKTRKYLPCCWMHRRHAMRDYGYSQDLYIKKSNIDGAGQGLFTRKRIKNGAKIGTYTGLRVGFSGHIKNTKYLAECGRPGKKFLVDSQNKDLWVSSSIRYANTASGRRYNNAVLIRDDVRITKGGKTRRGCSVKAIRNIPANGEIYLFYGDKYDYS